MTSPTTLRTLSKHIVEYSFLLPLVVQQVLKFVKKHGSYSRKKWYVFTAHSVV